MKSTRDYRGKAEAVRLRPSTREDLAWITALERRPDNRTQIGQWTDDEHLAAIERRGAREHWIIERAGERAGYLIAFDCRAGGAGIYVKRILVDRKEAGTGTSALATFLEDAFARAAVDEVWLIVRTENLRAQSVYRRLGFAPFEPGEAEAARYDAVAEAPMGKCFRMRKLSPAPRP